MPSSSCQSVLAFFYTVYLLFFPGWGLAQKVNETFSQEIFADDFSGDHGLWSVKSDAGNLFLIQNGEYLLKRMDKESEAAIPCKWKNPCPSFELKTNLKLDRASGPRSYAGIFFMMQENGSGGFLLELNMKKQVRIRQLVQGNYRLLTGSADNQGWIASPSAASGGTYNLLRIAYSEKNYDVFLNESLVKSFTELAYKNGNFGYTVGPGAIAHIDFLSVSTVEDCSPGKENKKETVKLTPLPVDSAQLIRQLQDENTLLKSEIQALRDSLKVSSKNSIKAPVKDSQKKKHN